MKRFKILFLTSIFYISSIHSQTLLFNEFMSSNAGFIRDYKNDDADWIEIYNPKSQSVNLLGYGLSDNATDVSKWTFPDIDINSHEHMIIYASNKDVSLYFDTIITKGDTWKYKIGTSEPPSDWNTELFDDTGWATGASGFGYGDGDDRTLISPCISLYIRKTFQLDNAADVLAILFHIDYDDGFVAYLNGTEISRDNVGIEGARTPFYAEAYIDREALEYQGGNPVTFDIDPESLLVDGKNVLAIQIHNRDAASSDLTAIPYLTLGRSNQLPSVRNKQNPLFNFTPLQLHSNFRINADGEKLFLTDPNGNILDSKDIRALPENISLGRYPDGGSEWFLLNKPTPGMENNNSVFSDIGEKPDFNLESGFYNDGQILTLSSVNDNANIYYTFDGSDPTRNSILYSSPITLEQTTVVRARCFVEGYVPSKIVTRSFLINENITLPIVSLTSDPANLWDPQTGIYVDENIDNRKEWERPAHIEFFEPDGTLGFDTHVGIRLFGRSALYLPQKSLSIFARDKYGMQDIDYPLFKELTYDTFDSFILRSSSDDWKSTMMRDGMMQVLLQDYFTIDYQAYRPAILFLNGYYWGIHNLREKYNEDYLNTRHDIKKDNLDILYHDVREETIEIISGDATTYRSLAQFLETHDMSLKKNYDYITSFINIDNFIEWVIAQSFYGNWSWNHNLRIWRPKTPDGKFEWLIFDLDRGFDRINENTLAEMINEYIFLNKLMDNNEFRMELLRRFAIHLNSSFKPSRVNHIIDSLKSNIQPEIHRHSQRWKNRCYNTNCGIQSYDTWVSHVNFLKNFALQRPSVVLGQIESLLNPSGRFNINLSVTPAKSGRVLLDSTINVTDSFKGIIFKNTSLQLTAIANPNYRFKKWEGTSVSLINRGDSWKYLDNGSNQGTAWREISFNDDNWLSGHTQMGYGDDDETTLIRYGSDPGNKHITTYFRHSFNIQDKSKYKGLTLHLLRDDGAVVYLNGTEVMRSNMPGTSINYRTTAHSTTSGAEEDTFYSKTIAADMLENGENVLAVEVHQAGPGSSDLSFDLEMEGVFEKGSGMNTSSDPHLQILADQDLEIRAIFEPDVTNLPSVICNDTTLLKKDSPFVVNSHLVICSSATVGAEPGVEIQVADGRIITVYGKINFIGTKDEPIIIKSKIGSNRWEKVHILHSRHNSQIKHVNISGVKTAIASENSDVTLDHLTTTDVFQAIDCAGSNMLVKNSSLDVTKDQGTLNVNVIHAHLQSHIVVENCDIYGPEIAKKIDQIDLFQVGSATLRGNRIHGSSLPSSDGIDLDYCPVNAKIENNVIFDCEDKGISLGNKSTATITGNVIYNCGMGLGIKDSAYANITQTTLYNNKIGMALYFKNMTRAGGLANVTNTIFSQSRDANTTADVHSRLTISYSLSDTRALPGRNNILADPLFIAPDKYNFHLFPNSPCIDAGNPNSSPDPDGTRADIGALPFNHSKRNIKHLKINEFMASNQSTIQDNAGDFDDWIELYNPHSESIQLTGIYLSDDFSRFNKWLLPDTLIPAHSHLLIWLDEDGSQGKWHANFKLDADGERVGLFDTDAYENMPIDTLSFSKQESDVSFGRLPDGEDQWMQFTEPTPGESNSVQETFTLQIRLFLEGAYSKETNSMKTLLVNTLPTTSPYHLDKITVDKIPSQAVDWILLQLRSKDGQTLVHKSLFLRNDGWIINDSDNTNISIKNISEGDYYIIIHHRTHLSGMSHNPITLTKGTKASYDFTNDSNKYWNNHAKPLSDNVFGLFSGDVDYSGTIDQTDFGLTWQQRNSQGYHQTDCNLNGTVDAIDRMIQWNNRQHKVTFPGYKNPNITPAPVP